MSKDTTMSVETHHSLSQAQLSRPLHGENNPVRRAVQAISGAFNRAEQFRDNFLNLQEPEEYIPPVPFSMRKDILIGIANKDRGALQTIGSLFNAVDARDFMLRLFNFTMTDQMQMVYFAQKPRALFESMSLRLDALINIIDTSLNDADPNKAEYASSAAKLRKALLRLRNTIYTSLTTAIMLAERERRDRDKGIFPPSLALTALTAISVPVAADVAGAFKSINQTNSFGQFAIGGGVPVLRGSADLQSSPQPSNRVDVNQRAILASSAEAAFLDNLSAQMSQFFAQLFINNPGDVPPNATPKPPTVTATATERVRATTTPTPTQPRDTAPSVPYGIPTWTTAETNAAYKAMPSVVWGKDKNISTQNRVLLLKTISNFNTKSGEKVTNISDVFLVKTDVTKNVSLAFVKIGKNLYLADIFNGTKVENRAPIALTFEYRKGVDGVFRFYVTYIDSKTGKKMVLGTMLNGEFRVITPIEYSVLEATPTPPPVPTVSPSSSSPASQLSRVISGTVGWVEPDKNAAPPAPTNAQTFVPPTATLVKEAFIGAETLKNQCLKIDTVTALKHVRETGLEKGKVNSLGMEEIGFIAFGQPEGVSYSLANNVAVTKAVKGCVAWLENGSVVIKPALNPVGVKVNGREYTMTSTGWNVGSLSSKQLPTTFLSQVGGTKAILLSHMEPVARPTASGSSQLEIDINTFNGAAWDANRSGSNIFITDLTYNLTEERREILMK